MFKTHILGHSIILHQKIRNIFTEVLIIWKKPENKKNIYQNFQMLEAGADEKQLTWLTASRAMILTWKFLFLPERNIVFEVLRWL